MYHIILHVVSVLLYHIILYFIVLLYCVNARQGEYVAEVLVAPESSGHLSKLKDAERILMIGL